MSTDPALTEAEWAEVLTKHRPWRAAKDKLQCAECRCESFPCPPYKVAQEVRRLQADNDRLREALTEIADIDRHTRGFRGEYRAGFSHAVDLVAREVDAALRPAATEALDSARSE